MLQIAVGTPSSLKCSPHMKAPIAINDPAHWRQRADESRRMAQQLTDADARQALQDIASVSYTHLTLPTILRV